MSSGHDARVPQPSKDHHNFVRLAELEGEGGSLQMLEIAGPCRLAMMSECSQPAKDDDNSACSASQNWRGVASKCWR